MTCIVLGISCQHGWQTIPSWTEEKQFIWRLNIAEQYKHGDEPDVHNGTTTDSAQWTRSLHVSYLRRPLSLTSVYVLHRELVGGGVFWVGGHQCEGINSPKQSQSFPSLFDVPFPTISCRKKTLLMRIFFSVLMFPPSCLILTQICNTWLWHGSTNSHIYVHDSTFINFILGHFYFLERNFWYCSDIHGHLHGLIYFKILNHCCLNRSSSLVAKENIVWKRQFCVVSILVLFYFSL